MPGDVEYKITLDDSDVLKRLHELSRRADALADKADRALETVSKEAKSSAVSIGLVSGAVAGLTLRLSHMGSQVIGDVVRMLKSLAREVITASDEFKDLSKEVEGFRDELIETAGEAFFEQIREDAERVLNILEEQRGPLSAIGESFGELLAGIERGTIGALLEQLEELDPQTMYDFADASDRLARALSELTGREISADLNGLVELLTMLSDLLTTLIGVYNTLNATLKPVSPLLQGVATAARTLLYPLGALIHTVGQLIMAWHDLNVQLRETAGFSLVDLTADLAEAVTPAGGGQAGLGSTLPPAARPPLIPPVEDVKKDAKKTKAEVDDFYQELARLEEAAARARQRMAERTAETVRDATARRLEIEVENARQAIDNEIKAAQEIEDIWRRHAQAIADAARDLGRDETDARRDAARAQLELERDAAIARADVERDYRRELLRIRDRFNQDAAEAERNNDAQAFLAAMRRQEVETTEAKRTRSEGVEDAAREADRQREELAIRLAQELEDIRITNARKLEDLQIRLQRELEEQAVTAQRREAERQMEYARELEDFARLQAQKAADLRRSLQDELATIREYDELKIQQAHATAARLRAIYNQFAGGQSSLGSSLPPMAGARRQLGGPVEAGRGYLVGEGGPEIYIPSHAGTIVPNAAIGPAMSNISNVYNQQRAMNVGGVHVSESIFDDPVAVRKMRNIIMGVLAETL